MQQSPHFKRKYRSDQAHLIVAAKIVIPIKIQLIVQPCFTAFCPRKCVCSQVVSLSALWWLVVANLAVAEVCFPRFLAQFQWLNRFAGLE